MAQMPVGMLVALSSGPLESWDSSLLLLGQTSPLTYDLQRALCHYTWPVLENFAQSQNTEQVSQRTMTHATWHLRADSCREKQRAPM